MTKHTLNERVEAVSRVIEHKKSVNAIAKVYDADITTVKSWVRKYQQEGEQGLHDCRGKTLESKQSQLIFPVRQFPLVVVHLISVPHCKESGTALPG